MKEISLQQITRRPAPAKMGSWEPALGATILYDHRATREWVMQLCQRTAQLVGADTFKFDWWKTEFLDHPQIFHDAVKSAIAADILVVSMIAAKDVPPTLIRWVEAWRPMRTESGVLVAMIGISEEAGSQSSPIMDYLRHVAAEAGMDFLSHERKYAPPPSGYPVLDATKPAPPVREMHHCDPVLFGKLGFNV